MALEDAHDDNESEDNGDPMHVEPYKATKMNQLTAFPATPTPKRGRRGKAEGDGSTTSVRGREPGRGAGRGRGRARGSSDASDVEAKPKGIKMEPAQTQNPVDYSKMGWYLSM